MEKKEFRNRIFIMQAVMIFYFITIISGSQLWGNIGSPIAAFVAGYLIWSTRRKMDNYKLNWTLVSILAFSWSFADTMWFVVSSIYGMDPEEMPIFMYLYLIPNIVLTISTILFFIKNVKRWYTVQLVLDVIVTLMIAFILIWQTMLEDYNFLLISYDDIMGTFLYLLTDILNIAIVAVMYMSARSHKISKSIQLLIIGIWIYALSDLYYTFLIFKDAYVPNSFIDFVYMSAIVMFSMASIYEAYKPTAFSRPAYSEAPEKVGGLFQYVLLVFLPVIFYLTGEFTVGAIWQLIVILIMYQVLSNYVQGTIRNEYLLRKEKQMNENLEDVISERTKDLLLANKALDELVKVDILTGLYNRRYFLEEIDKTINIEDSKFSVFYMDLDRFKTINDTHGHEMGDQILKEISQRLNNWKSEDAPAEDPLVARLGGDEFAVIIKGDTSSDRLGALCKSFIELFNKRIVIDSYIFNIGVSIGVSKYPEDAVEREQLMKYADIAMYNAKKEYGSKRFKLYNQGQSEIIQKRNEIEILLRNADFDKEFDLNFQPQFKIRDTQLIGAEALLRWNSPEKGRISPLEFIPIAEETGIILDIGSWVMKKAISQISYWNEKYQLDLVVGINISPRQIESVDFLADIKKLMESLVVDPKWVDFEITEHSAMNTNVIMEEILTELSRVGISISIDDFGTGYSSLSYIKRFDIDRLKIAKELIDNISSDRNALLIVKAIVMMAKGLNLTTIAEGVETEEQMNLLRMIGCDEVQGFLLSKPLSTDLFEDRFLGVEVTRAQNE